MSFLRKQSTRTRYAYALDTTMHILFLVGTACIPLFFLPFTRNAIDFPKQLFLTGIVSIVLFLWAIKALVTKELVIKRTMIDIPLLICLAASIISGVISIDTGQSIMGRVDTFVLSIWAMCMYALWFWIGIQITSQTHIWRWFLQSLILSTMLSAILFLGRDLSIFQGITTIVGFNTVSTINSTFGIFVAIGLVLSTVLAWRKEQTWAQRIVPLITMFVALYTLLKMGFVIPLVLVLIGLGLCIIVGATMISHIHKAVYGGIIGVAVLIAIAVFAGIPNTWKIGLPVEVALGFFTSWDVTISSVFQSIKNFLFGSGPGTFVYSFSQYRPDAFNTHAIAESIRFTQPVNTVLAFATEFGMLALLSFLSIQVMVFVMYVHQLIKAVPRIKKKSIRNHVLPEVFGVGIVWIVLSIGLWVAFFDTTLWWLWWWLLALIIMGLSWMAKEQLQEKKVHLQVSVQHMLAWTAVVLGVSLGILLMGIFTTRMYLAEVWFAKSQATQNQEEIKTYMSRALDLRPRHTTYRLALARQHLEEARIASESPDQSGEYIAEALAQAVNQAKIASEQNKQSVETWETLATMYINTRAFVPDANVWAIDALQNLVEREPSNAIAYWQLGDAYVFDQKYKDAEDAYKRAILLKPNFVVAYISLASAHEAEENIEKAIETLENGQAYLQEQPSALYMLGRLYFNRNNESDLSNAQIAWEAAIQKEPNYTDALFSLGLLHEKKGEYDKALTYYKKAQNILPNNPDIQQKVQNLGG